MNGFVRKAVAGFCLGTGAFTLVGCSCYRDWVDPCWPERYNNSARISVIDIHNTQAQNGHVLDQTVWNWMFETDAKTGSGSNKLNAGGRSHLEYLARRRPAPDPRVFVQTSHDVVIANNQGGLQQVVANRNELDSRRVDAVREYLTALMAGKNSAIAFDVQVHDPAPVGMPANPILGNQPRPTYPGVVPQLYQNFKGSIPDEQGEVNSGGGGGGGGGGGQ